MQFLSILNVILMEEWKFGYVGLIVIGAVFNLGLFLGACTCAFYADKVGRRNILLVATIV